MAFLSKFGNILRQTAGGQINAEFSASRPSIYQAVRFMSSSKLFIGGISYSTNENSLREAFSKYGEVIEARIILDRESGRSRGFGFVTYTSSEDASSAIQALDGQDLDGRRIRVNYAADRPRSNFGGGGYGGGYNNSYGGNFGNPASNYGGGYGGNYGAGGGYGSRENYGSNFGGSYAGGNVSSAGDGDYAGGKAFDSGSTGAFGSSAGNYGVAGGGGGSDNFGSGSIGGGFNDSTGFGYGGDDKFGVNESSSLGDGAGGYNQDDPLESNYGNDTLEGNFKDDDDDAGDFAKRA